jgi:hypothetical protein
MYVYVATGGLSGDHIESASPADPSFWVIHPTLERLLHAKLLSGGFADESWAADQIDDFVCSNHGLCAMNDSGRRVGTVDGGVQFIYVCMYVDRHTGVQLVLLLRPLRGLQTAQRPLGTEVRFLRTNQRGGGYTVRPNPILT